MDYWSEQSSHQQAQSEPQLAGVQWHLVLSGQEPQQPLKVLVQRAAVVSECAAGSLGDWLETVCCEEQALLGIVKQLQDFQMQLAVSWFLWREQRVLLRLVVLNAKAQRCQAAVRVEETTMLNLLQKAEQQ